MFTTFRKPALAASLLCTSYLTTRSTSCAAAAVVPPPRPNRGNLVSLKNKTVLITGASAGIGEACAWRFADEGSNLILLGRREEKLNELKNNILHYYPKLNIHVLPMSTIEYEKVSQLPNTLPPNFQNVDILVNNAGLALGVEPAHKNNVEDARQVIETNVMGVIAMTTAFLPGMISRGYGHIINMGSIAGHQTYSCGSVYNASKFAVNGYTDAIRHDLIETPVRVTHISPGLVGETEFSKVRLGSEEKAKEVYKGIEALKPDDIADNVIYAVSFFNFFFSIIFI